MTKQIEEKTSKGYTEVTTNGQAIQKTIKKTEPENRPVTPTKTASEPIKELEAKAPPLTTDKTEHSDQDQSTPLGYKDSLLISYPQTKTGKVRWRHEKIHKLCQTPRIFSLGEN